MCTSLRSATRTNAERDAPSKASRRKYLKRRGPLPIDEVLRIGVCLAETLQCVHEQGVVHRDLKPDNIVVGPDGRITLMDFGIALRQPPLG